MKRYFHEELEDLRNKLILLGEKTNEAARMAVEDTCKGDLEIIERANQLDNQIDELEARSTMILFVMSPCAVPSPAMCALFLSHSRQVVILSVQAMKHTASPESPQNPDPRWPGKRTRRYCRDE